LSGDPTTRRRGAARHEGNAMTLIARISIAMLGIALAPGALAACDPDGLQDSGSIYRICMPDGFYNGRLVIWAHGFQDAGTPISIPEDQLCFADLCLPDLVTSLGFAFATNSYSKTGLAIRQGMADIVDLVDIFTEQKGAPERVYLTGASEGGIITALLAEQRPDVFAAGVAACGPVGSFRYQINYFGNARVTFEVFWPGLIPGDPLHPSQELIDIWPDYYDTVVKPVVMSEPDKLRQWAAVARLPSDDADWETTIEQSVRDVLRYAVINLNDAVETIGAFPFGNVRKVYDGSLDDELLNDRVLRVEADPAALAEMHDYYDTTGVLDIPLVTLHTTRDQQVPGRHERFFIHKTIASGAYDVIHESHAYERYGHCNFTSDEVLAAFFEMLMLEGDVAQARVVDEYRTRARERTAGGR
jgi:pimeloyl-ACP methyl ester carboxylesterase